MAAVASAVASDIAVPVRKYSKYAPRTDHLKAYQYQPGHAPANGVGRPKGSRNAVNVLLDAAPKIAQRYIKEALKGNPSLLVDSRKWIMPTSEDHATPNQVIVFMGDAAHETPR